VTAGQAKPWGLKPDHMRASPCFVDSLSWRVVKGQPVFEQDDADDRAAVDRALRLLRQARGQPANLLSPAKPREIEPELWPMALFAIAVIAFASFAYRETPD
jgi:hypothetical protein